MEIKWPFQLATYCFVLFYLIYITISSHSITQSSPDAMPFKNNTLFVGSGNFSQRNTGDWVVNTSLEKPLWKPSNLTPPAFRGWLHWEPGLKFHKPCRHDYSHACCDIFMSRHKMKLIHIEYKNMILSAHATVRDFLAKVNNKKVVFIGDSVMLNLFHSVVDLILSEFAPNANQNLTLKISKQQVHIQRLVNSSWGLSLTNIYHFGMKGTEICVYRKEMNLSWDMLQQFAHQSDIILFNMGLHYHLCPNQVFMTVMEKVTGILRAELQTNPQKQVVLRGNLPQHFPGNNGYFAFTKVQNYRKIGCTNKTTEREFFTNYALKSTAKENNFKYMDSFPFYMERWDLHDKKKKHFDCSHYCITAEITVPELALLNSLLD